MRQIDLLRELQEHDSALEAARTALERAQAELADRAAVLAARTTRDALAATLRTLETDQRDLELDVDRHRERLQAVEAKLYGGRVGDAKELSNLNREAGQMRGLISTREDRLLELFERVEQATDKLKTADSSLRALATARVSRESELSAERDRLVASIDKDESARSRVREQIAAPSLRTYDNLFRTRGGLAVAEVKQRTCQGCRIGMTVSEESRARHGDPLVFCQSCGRILFAAQ